MHTWGWSTAKSHSEKDTKKKSSLLKFKAKEWWTRTWLDPRRRVTLTLKEKEEKKRMVENADPGARFVRKSFEIVVIYTDEKRNVLIIITIARGTIRIQ